MRTHHFHDYVGLLYEQCTPIRTVSYFSNKYDEIAEAIGKQLDRGVTILNGEGWYSKEPRKVLVVLAKRREGIEIFRLIHRIDPKAFVSQSNVVGVYGEGFDKLKIK